VIDIVEIKDVDQPEPTGNLLNKVFYKLGLKYLEDDEKLKDKYGVFAYNLKNFVVVAKRYIYGNIVSCHKRAVVSAMNQKKPLIMYIDQVDKFYQFDPKEIFENSKENLKGGEKMLNFDIRLGKHIEIGKFNRMKCPLCYGNLIFKKDVIGSQEVDYVCESGMHYWSEDYLKEKFGVVDGS